MKRLKIRLSALLAFIVASSAVCAESHRLADITPHVPDVHPANVGAFEWPGLADLNVSEIIEYGRQLLLIEHPELESSDLFATWTSVQYEPGRYPGIHLVFADVTNLDSGKGIDSRVPVYDVWIPAKGSSIGTRAGSSIAGLYPSTLFVLPTKELADPFLGSLESLDQRLAVRWSGLGRVELAKLWSAILRETYDPSLVDKFEALNAKERFGYWAYRVPDDLVSQLAYMSKSQLERIAGTWTVSDEYYASTIRNETVPDLLRQLSILATYAKESGAAMVLSTQL